MITHIIHKNKLYLASCVQETELERPGDERDGSEDDEDGDKGQGGEDEDEGGGVKGGEENESCEEKRKPEMKATRSKKPFYYMVLSHIKRSQLSNMYNSFKHQSKLSTINMLYYIIGSILRCLDQGGSQETDQHW